MGWWVGGPDGLAGGWLVGRWVRGLVGVWAGGTAGHWAGGPVGRWAGGSVGFAGRWVGGQIVSPAPKTNKTCPRLQQARQGPPNK